MNGQLNMFEEQKKVKYNSYREWLYRGHKERAEQKNKEREAKKTIMFVSIQNRSVRPLNINDLKLK